MTFAEAIAFLKAQLLARVEELDGLLAAGDGDSSPAAVWPSTTTTTEGSTMAMLEAAAVKLGLPKNATEEQVVAEIDRRDSKRRDALVAKAAAEGRIADTPANRKKWRSWLLEPGAEAVLASLTPVRLSDPPAPVEDQVFSSGGLGGMWGFDRPAAERAPMAPPEDDTIDGSQAPADWFRGVQ